MRAAYDEIIDFIAAGPTPREIVEYRPSDTSRRCVLELIQRQRSGRITPEEQSQLACVVQIEHLMRLIKARARHYL
jgi:hypothetical protein